MLQWNIQQCYQLTKTWALGTQVVNNYHVNTLKKVTYWTSTTLESRNHHTPFDFPSQGIQISNRIYFRPFTLGFISNRMSKWEVHSFCAMK